jgi:TRAP-type mannitol/chloroaromatic compound transport system permease small subunit
MRKVFRVIDSISEGAGGIARWFGLLLVLVVVYDVVARYVFDAPTIWGYEVGIALGMSLYCWGYAYTEKMRGHVRVDVFYVHISPRAKAVIDTIGGFIFFLPPIRLSFSPPGTRCGGPGASWKKAWRATGTRPGTHSGR